MSFFGQDKPRFGRDEAVEATVDFHRIASLPRRVWLPDAAEKLADELTELFKQPRGTMRLRPVQALALAEIAEFGGLFGPIGVGQGKTLITLLAPALLEAKQPLLILPAALKKKTTNELFEYSNDWKIPTNIRIMSYEELGRTNAANDLTLYKPDFIGVDEGHKLKNRKAAVTKRVMRYMSEHPSTRFVALSGTIMTKGLEDFAHLLRWSLKEGAPIPREYGELKMWADAIDESTNPLSRVKPGVLRSFARGEDLAGVDDTTVARRGFCRRLTETPGVVATSGDLNVGSSLLVRAIDYELDDEMEEHFKRLRSSWTTPTGWVFSEAAECWRHAREMALGLTYRWEPDPPKDWLQARAAWAKFVREKLKVHTVVDGVPLDSELQVRRACEKGALDRSALDAWKRIESSYTPRTRAEWHDSRVLELCDKWMNAGPGIVWVEHTLFGQELARRTGVPFYGASSIDLKTRRSILDADPKKPMIASVAANGTGKNLQKWSRNLITSMMSGSDVLEQLLGRTHRPGQTADTVEVDVLFGCLEHYNSMEKARANARAICDSMGAPQKILVADLLWPTELEFMHKYHGARWTKQVETPLDDLLGWS